MNASVLMTHNNTRNSETAKQRNSETAKQRNLKHSITYNKR